MQPVGYMLYVHAVACNQKNLLQTFLSQKFHITTGQFNFFY